MSHLVLQILPLACGAAIIPTLLMIAVLSLSSPVTPLRCGWAVVAGSVLALSVYTVVGLLIGSAFHHSQHKIIDEVIAFAAAALLAGLAFRQYLSLGKPAKGKSLAQRLNQTSPRAYFVAGMATMFVNITSIVLFLPAIRDISKSNAGLGSCVVALAVLFLFLQLPVVVPVGVISVLGKRAMPLLAKLHHDITTYTVQITIGVEIFFFFYFFIKGIVELTS